MVEQFHGGALLLGRAVAVWRPALSAAAATSRPALSQGPVSGSGRPERRMNRSAQNAARPNDSGTEPRRLA